MAYESKEAKKPESSYLDWIREYKEKVQKELEKICNDICETIDLYLLKKAQTSEAKVFYHKMKGDYYRYIAENVDGDTKKKYSDKGLEAYNNAKDESESLKYNNPIKLGLALNLSVFYYEVVGNKEEACKAMVHQTVEFKPNPENVMKYEYLYRNAYLKMYPNLKDVYKNIKEYDDKYLEW